jgi:hypothetical protein
MFLKREKKSSSHNAMTIRASTASSRTILPKSRLKTTIAAIDLSDFFRKLVYHGVSRLPKLTTFSAAVASILSKACRTVRYKQEATATKYENTSVIHNIVRTNPFTRDKLYSLFELEGIATPL